MFQEHPFFWRGEPDNDTYDAHQLFLFYNERFFLGELSSCVVRWTKKMTLCAGTCKYEGTGSSTISLSEPLLKFRTNNQLKQTLLHEMIHAYLFRTNPRACQVDNGHGPAFLEIMDKINSITGLKLSVFHQFHDEVNFYRQHVWRCNGICQKNSPHYGYVRRAMNRPPQKADPWFAQHQRICGGEYIKIQSPPEKKESQEKNNQNQKQKQKKNSIPKDHKSMGCGKSIQDYMKEITEQNSKKSQQIKKSNENRPNNIDFKNLDEYSFKSETKTNEKIFDKGKAKTIEQYYQQIMEESQKAQQK